jgi:hypothetical protein
MNAETFAEWMRRQGHRVFRTTSSYWYTAGPRVLQAFPYHWQITPSEGEINELMQRNGIISLRYSTPLDFPEGKVSYHIVLGKQYCLDNLKSQARNGVKHGLKCFRVGQISFERLAKEGWALQQDTLDRQNRLHSMTQSEWESICRAAIDLPGFEAWAALADEELAAALIICRIDNMFNVPYALSHRKYLCNHVNNALFYSVNCNLLEREGISGIFFTVQSLDAPSSVDEFKFRMGLNAIAVRQRVAFHPWLKSFATNEVHSWATRRLQHDPSNPFLAKAEGMLRFYLHGQRPIDCQEWPECLSQYKTEAAKEKVLS